MILYRTNPLWTNRNHSNGKSYQQGNACTKPSTNIVERDDDFVLNMALPGYSKKDIIIDIDQDVLKISSELAMNQQEADHVLMHEFSIRPFARRFQLPDSADAEQVQASFTNGVLSITIPKKEYAKAKPPREIAIA